VEYRRAIAAYVVAHALAGEPLPGFGFALGLAKVAAVAVETDEYADDVRVKFFDGYMGQVQAKRTLRFGAVLKSAVAQWGDAAEAGLDPIRDRLILVTGVASGPVRVLKRALERCKTDEPGAFTREEMEVLGTLDGMLPGLTAQQRKRVRQCAVITIVDVEEEDSPGAAHARLLLGRVVGGGNAAVRAWRDLVSGCGRVGRLRGGFGIEGWVRLLQGEGHQVAGFGTPAEGAARQAEALDRYRDLLRTRGTMVDLRPLGVEVAPIPLADLDATAECVPEGADRRDAEPLPWSLLRRCRVLLTGLPGGGKSVALAAAAAVLVDAAGAPLPLMVSLRDVDAHDRSRGFVDRVLDTAVKDLRATDRPLVRAELERGLQSGSTALLLDSLDETHARRGEIVSEIEGMCAGVSADVPVLLATRDVAYAQAATLGWDDLRLVKPEKPERAVRAVLRAVAASRGMSDSETWVERRLAWVKVILDRDHAVAETVLMPVLLALLAAERSNGALPVTHAEILHGVVAAAVRRREARRDPGLQLASLNEHDSANATLAAFAVEARVLGDAGGHAPMAAVEKAVASFLAQDWGLPTGAATSSARAIVHFWDEIGVFVIHGGDERVAPRMEVFLDIGDAVQASTQSPQTVASWVDARIRERRHEPLILAAALSEDACARLLTTACNSGEHELLIAAGAAVRQHACVSASDRERLVTALAKDAANPDKQGWTSYVTMLGCLGEHHEAQDPAEVLKHYPPEYKIIAKVEMALRSSFEPVHEQDLLEVFRIQLPEPLPDRQSSAASAHAEDIANALYGDVVEAAARRMLGRVEEATSLVIGMLRESSINMHPRLLGALRDAGLASAANNVLAEQSQGFAWASMLRDYDPDAHLPFLDHLVQFSPTELDAAQASRLDELAALCQTLELRAFGAWPRIKEFASWLEFVDVIRALGGFDPARIAAEAAVMQRRVAQFGRRAFSAMDIASPYRRLERWHTIDAVEDAARAVAQALFMGPLTAAIAAEALSAAPPEIAIPLLEDAIPQLESRHRHQRVAALALAELKDGEPLRKWATSDNPTLRRVAAQLLPNTVGDTLNPLLRQLMHDTDHEVADAAVRNIARARTRAAAEELEHIAGGQDKWTCQQCGSSHVAKEDSCTKFHVVLPNPAETARDMLTALTKPSIPELQR
jgi:hypothetical protein